MRKYRKHDQIREIKLNLNYTPNPQGSVLIEVENTRVICTAIIEDKVPFFLKGKRLGWLSCEYSMLPGSTHLRKIRDISKGKIDGRTQEIQRLIGRSLRSCIDFSKIPDKTIWVDCDVISADGGTRTASINGAFIAISLAIKKAIKNGTISENPIKSQVAAISVGIVDNKKLLDLDYKEDSKADVDLNVIVNEKLDIIEIQGTAEGKAFSRRDLNDLLDLSEIGLKKILDLQNKALLDKESLVLSSDNLNKLREMKEIMKDLPINIISKTEANLGGIEVEEVKSTLEGNARLKARAIKEKTPYSVIADDTGLFIEDLNGEPGVYSARYSDSNKDEDNRDKVLKKLGESKNRNAYFKTVLIYINSDGKEFKFEGICRGRIAYKEKGSNGFGYDSIFIPDGYNKTFAEVSSIDKNRISHRNIALNEFKDFLNKKYKFK
ncbi:MAG: ribonuclease PH [Peptoniphilaceae bacterium]